MIIRNRKTSLHGAESTQFTVSKALGDHWANPLKYFEALKRMRAARVGSGPLKPQALLQEQNGKIINNRMGKKQLNVIARKIAAHNKLDEKKYSFYSLRRTSATAAVEGGASVQQLRIQLGHKSLGAAQEYVDNSTSMQLRMSEMIANTTTSTSTTTSSTSASTATASTTATKRAASPISPEARGNFVFQSGAFAGATVYFGNTDSVLPASKKARREGEE